jgi:L-glyceraldehyde 3-phosphate reductase
MAISWVLRDNRVTSALIGASKKQQIVDCVNALKNIQFSSQELDEINKYAKDGGINIWQQSAR